jgi:urate oxidase
VIELGANRYGKSAIRLVRVIRDAERHTVRDLTLGIALEGDFSAAHTEGDNGLVVATDTMKNAVYAFAREHLTGSIERFGHVLARHFANVAQVATATVSIDEHRWVRVPTDDGPAPDAFLRSGDFTRTVVVTAGDEGDTFESGLRDLTVMKTAKSAFSGFPRDEYTTLADTEDRLMATRLSATWRYGTQPPADFDAAFDAIGATLLEVFAEHRSLSVQHSIWVMGEQILERHPEVDQVRMVLPNLHHWLADLRPFGQDNAGEVFIATTEPHGLIDATVRRAPAARG